MDKSGVIGEISENLGGVVKQTVKQVVKTPVDLTKTATSQVTGNDQASMSSELDQIEKAAVSQGQTGQKKQQNPVLSSSNLAAKQAEDKEKIEKLRRQLHREYYEDLTKPKKPAEEHAAEKVEREQREEEYKLQEDAAKKPPPLPATVKQGTGEKLVGVSG